MFSVNSNFSKSSPTFQNYFLTFQASPSASLFPYNPSSHFLYFFLFFLPAQRNLKLFYLLVPSLNCQFLPSSLLFILLSVLGSHRGHRKQRVVYFLSVRRPRAMSQQLLDGDPVVEDSPVPLLHDLLLAQ